MHELAIEPGHPKPLPYNPPLEIVEKLTTPEPMTFQHHPKGEVTVSHFAPSMDIAPDFLFAADRRLVVTVIRFKLANGRASYRVTGWDASRQCFTAERISYEMTKTKRPKLLDKRR